MNQDRGAKFDTEVFQLSKERRPRVASLPHPPALQGPNDSSFTNPSSVFVESPSMKMSVCWPSRKESVDNGGGRPSWRSESSFNPLACLSVQSPVEPVGRPKPDQRVAWSQGRSRLESTGDKAENEYCTTPSWNVSESSFNPSPTPSRDPITSFPSIADTQPSRGRLDAQPYRQQDPLEEFRTRLGASLAEDPLERNGRLSVVRRPSRLSQRQRLSLMMQKHHSRKQSEDPLMAFRHLAGSMLSSPRYSYMSTGTEDPLSVFRSIVGSLASTPAGKRNDVFRHLLGSLVENTPRGPPVEHLRMRHVNSNSYQNPNSPYNSGDECTPQSPALPIIVKRAPQTSLLPPPMRPVRPKESQTLLPDKDPELIHRETTGSICDDSEDSESYLPHVMRLPMDMSRSPSASCIRLDEVEEDTQAKVHDFMKALDNYSVQVDKNNDDVGAAPDTKLKHNKSSGVQTYPDTPADDLVLRLLDIAQSVSRNNRDKNLVPQVPPSSPRQAGQQFQDEPDVIVVALNDLKTDTKVALNDLKSNAEGMFSPREPMLVDGKRPAFSKRTSDPLRRASEGGLTSSQKKQIRRERSEPRLRTTSTDSDQGACAIM